MPSPNNLVYRYEHDDDNYKLFFQFHFICQLNKYTTKNNKNILNFKITGKKLKKKKR